MDISKIDKNFNLDNNIPENDVVWYNVAEAPFKLYGGLHTAQGYLRIPQDIAETVSEGVKILNHHTAGIRARFKTNSPYIAISVNWSSYGRMNHMAASGSSGFDLFKVKNRIHSFMCSFIPSAANPTEGFSGIKYLNIPKLEDKYSEGEVADYILNFPLYNCVTDLFIGVKKGSVLETGDEYSFKLPIVFYGSSITQGGCASRPGNCYQNFLSREFDFDYINLGFSGSGKGEEPMVDYMADLKMSAFVSDYDHNAPTQEHLEKTHYNMYEKIRAKNPDIPYIIVGKPDFDNVEWKRRATVFETFARAKAQGDKNVFYVDSCALFSGIAWDDCTVDGCHPTDLGFYKMYEAFLPTFKTILAK